MNRITPPLLKSLVTFAVLTVGCLGAWAEDKPARAPVPTINLSGVSGVGEYLAEHATDELYALFQRDKNLTALVVSYAFGNEGSRQCVAQVGLTHAPSDKGDMPRTPELRFLGGASDPSFSKEKCESVAVTRALDELVRDDFKTLQAGLERTLLLGGKRTVEKFDGAIIYSRYSGMREAGSQYISSVIPAWFSRAFDYRAVSLIKRFHKIEGDNDQVICFASLGLTSRAPEGRQTKEPMAESARILTLNKNNRSAADKDATCFDPLFNALVRENIQPGSDMIKAFIDNWPRVTEPGLKAPTIKDVKASIAWQGERDRKAAAAQRTEEARYQRVAQQNSCTVNCVNGACVRRWPNGRSERFQAPRKFNPFTSQFEWDTSGC